MKPGVQRVRARWNPGFIAFAAGSGQRGCARMGMYARTWRDFLVRDKPSVYEVARDAGVSTATVSRVLAGHERVLPVTRDKVLSAVAELGYVPSGAARDLAARRTGVLGLCFPDLGSPDLDQDEG